MVELLERFVTAVEILAAASQAQAEILAKNYNPMMVAPPIVPESGETAQTETKKRKKKGEEVPKEEPTTEPPKETALEAAAREVLLKPEPEKQITTEDLNAMLRKIAANPKLGLPVAKDTLKKHGKADKIADMDPALYPVLFKACEEVLNAA